VGAVETPGEVENGQPAEAPVRPERERLERDHFVPAAYIGLFGATDQPPSRRLRQRAVWVGTREAANPYITTAESRARHAGLYDLPRATHLGGHLDHWSYEAHLPGALSAVSDSRDLDAATWLDTLVPFVAGLWVRGPDRNRGVNNEGRIVEFQEVLAPAMAARWRVLHFPGGPPLVTNDRGCARMSVRREPALVVPLTPSAVLVLTDKAYSRIRRGADGMWIAPIEHDSRPNIDPRVINQVVAKSSIRDIYGPMRASVVSARSSKVIDPQSRGLPFLATDTDLRAHFYDWYRLMAALRAGRGAEQEAANRADWSLLMLPPETPVAVEVLRGERTLGGVYAIGGDLVVSLRFGQRLRRIREEVGDFPAGATVVMSAHDLQNAPIQSTIGELWRVAPGDPSSAQLSDIQSDRRLSVDLRALSDSIAAELRTTASPASGTAPD
jgi:hypothetical protein